MTFSTIENYIGSRIHPELLTVHCWSSETFDYVTGVGRIEQKIVYIT